MTIDDDRWQSKYMQKDDNWLNVYGIELRATIQPAELGLFCILCRRLVFTCEFKE
jgi:hypothetical protein